MLEDFDVGPLLLRESQQRRERDQGYRKVKQEGVRCRSGSAWITKHKLHNTHVSLVLPFEEPNDLLDSGKGSGAFFGHSKHHSEKSKQRELAAGVMRIIWFLLSWLLLGESAAQSVGVG